MNATNLVLLMNVLWALAYVLIIWKSHKDKSYGMPAVALCANLSWEFIFTFIYTHGGIQGIFHLLWFALDLVILFQFFIYAPKEFPNISKTTFFSFFAVTQIAVFCVLLTIAIDLKEVNGTYTGFGQNLMMSMLFINMLIHRGSLRGQSVYIALSKMLGTCCASLTFIFFVDTHRHSQFLYFCYAGIFFFDLIYLYLCIRQQRIDALKAAAL